MTSTLPHQATNVLPSALPTTHARVTGQHAPLRWLHVMSHTDPRYGGLSSAVPALAAPLQEAGVVLSLAAFCLPSEAYRPAELTSDQTRFWPTSRRAWLLERDLRAHFAAAVREVDGVHVHGLWEASTAAGCAAARRQGKPYVLSAHGMLEPWALATKRAKKRVYAALFERAHVRGAACLHALTAAEAEQYRAFGAKGPIAVIPNAVRLPVIADREPFLNEYPELRGKRSVLFLSRFHPKKGLDLLVEAWAHVARANPDAHLVLAGPDADGMGARLRERCRELGTERQVLFPGMLTGAAKWSAYAAAEAFVLPSHSEGLSMALLEAMGMGLPVMATHACNMPEISQRAAGWEFAPRVDSLVEVLEAVLARSPEENRAMGACGAALVAERYGQEQVAEQMASVYRFVLGGEWPQQVDLRAGGRS